MAIIALTPVEVSSLSAAAVYTGSLTTTDTYTAPCDGRTILNFKKSAAVTCNITFITPGTWEGLALLDQVSGVNASGGELMFMPAVALFQDPVTKLISFTFSDVAGLTVGVFRF